jgi:hypothetical protein
MTTIVNQIQTSITGEAKDNLGRYDEKKSIYKIKHKLPLKPSHRDGKHQVPPPAKQQHEKHQGVW